MRIARYTIPLIGMLCFTFSSATSVGISQAPIEGLIKQSDYVLRARVLRAQVLEFDYESKKYQCGTLYVADVVEELKGEIKEETITFSSNFQLRANGEYVIFLRASNQEIRKSLNRSSEETAIFRSKELNACVAHLPTLNTDGSPAALEFLAAEYADAADAVVTSRKILLPRNVPITLVRIHNCAPTVDPDNCMDVVQFPTAAWADLKGSLSIADPKK